MTAGLRRRHALFGVTTYPPGSYFEQVVDLYTGKILFVVDVSGSMEGRRLAEARVGALKLLTTAVRMGYVAGVIHFAGAARLALAPTTDLKRIERTIKNLEVEWTGTNLSKGIALGHDRLRSLRGDRVLALFTDGETNRRSAIRAAEAARADGIRVICEFGGTADPRLMKALADSDGWSDRRAARDGDVAARIGALVKELR